MSDRVPVTVSWGSQKYELTIDPSSRVSAVLRELEALTLVPLDRQKLMMRRKQLKPDDAWDPADLRPGLRLLLLGTADPPPVLPVGPAPDDDSPIPNADPEDEDAVPKGLKNYDNTCFLNAVLQVLRHLPDFTSQVCQNPIADDESAPKAIAAQRRFARALQSFFVHFPDGLFPLVTALRDHVPAFGEKGQDMRYQQQDAAECWAVILEAVRSSLSSAAASLFEIKFARTVDRTGEPTETVDNRLACHIQGTTRTIEEGVSLDSDVEETVDGSIVIRHIHLEIVRLPRYLTIQMMRFFFRRDEQNTAKITKRVDHPMKLDALPWVSADLRAQLVEARRASDACAAGWYQLKAIITHRGQTVHSGHYIAHVRVGETWTRYDDERVEDVEHAEIVALSGERVNWHTSYLLVYEQL